MSKRRFAHYEILDRIGEGGMGVVYRARDTLLERPVAIKMMTLLAVTPKDRQLLLREARAAAALNHPNITTIYEVGEAAVDDRELLGPLEDESGDGGAVPYIAMEYVEGEDLRSRLRRGPLPLDDAVTTALQIAQGIEAAHKAKIVHRDLKPANVILDPEGHVKLLDFGLAKFLKDGAFSEETRVWEGSLVTRQGLIVGSIPYMAPEQLEGRQVDERCDLFALGVVLYEMIAGRPPFRAKAPVEYYKALAEEPEPLSAVHPDMPLELWRIVHKLLAADPEERYQLTHEVVTDLTALARGDSGPVTATTVSARLAPAGGRPRWTRWAALLSVVAVLALAALYRADKARRERAGPLYELTVRPFVNRTGDANQDYFSEGVSTVLVNQLTAVRGINDIDSSAARPRLLTGDVRRDLDRIAVDLAFVDEDTDAVLWQETVAGERDAVLELQVELARAVVRALEIPLSWSESRRLRRPPTRSADGFEFYLQALPFLRKPDGLRKAEERLREAIGRDEEFALAHASLSEALWQIYLNVDIGNQRVLDEAEAEAMRAVELGAELPRARMALARVYRGRKQYATAINMLRWVSWRYPSLGEAHHQLAITYRLDDQLCSARDSAREAAHVEPDSWRHHDELGGIYLSLGDYDAAREAFKAAAELAPPDSRARRNLFAVQVIAGDYDGAVETSASLPRPISNARLANNIATAYFYTGHLDEARRYFELALSLTEDNLTRVALRQNLGDLMARRGLQEKAKEEYRRGLDLLQEAPEMHTYSDAPLWRALLLAKIEDCYSATTLGRDLEQRLPESIDKHYFLAKTYALCGSRGEALAAIEKAIHLGALGRVMRLEDEFESLQDEPAFAGLTALEPELARCP